jgi:hypothetical protein
MIIIHKHSLGIIKIVQTYFLYITVWIQVFTREFQDFSSGFAIFYHLNEFLRVYRK